MSTVKTINLQHPSSASNNIVLDSSGNATVANNATVSGNITVTGTGSVGGNFSFNSGYGSAAVAYGCRAWVNFDGTGTVAIRADGGVSSITDNGTGDYTVNFDVTLPDANYCVVVTGQSTSGTNTNLGAIIKTGSSLTTSSVTVISGTVNTGGVLDLGTICVSIFR